MLAAGAAAASGQSGRGSVRHRGEGHAVLCGCALLSLAARCTPFRFSGAMIV